MICGRCYATGAPTSNNPPRLLDKRIEIHQLTALSSVAPATTIIPTAAGKQRKEAAR
jgi:hypothetical protein